MGWNQGFTIFEETICGAYRLGILDRKLFKVLAKPYAGSDIDEGGSNDTTVRGLSVKGFV